MKREIYEANCKINGGFYKKDTIVKLPNSSERYKLKLTKREIEVLEPSVYVQSYRIKSSMKKATLLLRLLGGLDVMKAISQCHFSNKKIAREVAELLQKGVKDGQKLGLKPEDLYISQIWTGSDGFWRKRVEFKARTRIGIISHPYIHVRCILRTKSVTKRRLAYEAHLKEQKERHGYSWEISPLGVLQAAYISGENDSELIHIQKSSCKLRKMNCYSLLNLYSQLCCTKLFF